ncbi:peptide arginase family protein [Paucidesulfovibrio longus]|uniref:UPF0489 family protein n=1 Tax=Paucidesulfovibrio longus TaxID=889 RepID=UPI0003B301E7|nr:UPF0489 family protein [Paucidesulfovibrio longus]
MTDAHWLIPFTGRADSAALHMNFLWNDGNAYVMDNHRAALWCWSRHMAPGRSYGLLHVDQHYDAVLSRRDLAHLGGRGLLDFSLDGYLDEALETDFLTSTPLFRWDNYIGLLMGARPELVHDWAFATHGKGLRPDAVEIFEMQPWQLPLLDLTQGGPWLVNLDVDYFFFRGPDAEMRPLFSEEYVRAVAAPVVRAHEAGQLACLTVSLSPECCGGWTPAEKLAEMLCAELGLDFRLF